MKMKARNIDELLKETANRSEVTNMVDQWLVMILAGRRDKKFLEPFETQEDLKEFNRLVQAAASSEKAFAAILAYRDCFEAEAANNRTASVKHCTRLIELIDKQTFPRIWAMTHLRKGTVLAMFSREANENTRLAEAAKSLEQCLQVFVESEDGDLCALAHYNLALAYHNMSGQVNDWEGADQSFAEKSLNYGKQAIKLMDQGISCGSRTYLTEALLQVAVGEGRQRMPFVVDLLRGLLKSNEGKKLNASDRKRFQEMLDQALKC